MQGKRPRGWRSWLRVNGPIAPAPRAELERFLELAHPGPGAARERLRLLILYVAFEYRDRDAVMKIARHWDLGPDKAEEFVRGAVESGFSWYSIAGILGDCGADQVFIDVARELFESFPRDEPARAEPGAPRRPGEADEAEAPDSPGLAETAEPPSGGGERQVVLKPDPRNAATVPELIESMVKYRQWQGRPAFRQMAADSRYSYTTFAGLAARTTLPKMDLMVDYLKGCGADETELEAWRVAWRRLSVAEPEPPGDIEQPPA